MRGESHAFFFCVGIAHTEEMQSAKLMYSLG